MSMNQTYYDKTEFNSIIFDQTSTLLRTTKEVTQLLLQITPLHYTYQFEVIRDIIYNQDNFISKTILELSQQGLQIPAIFYDLYRSNQTLLATINLTLTKSTPHGDKPRFEDSYRQARRFDQPSSVYYNPATY
jgi:hypothetical protein